MASCMKGKFDMYWENVGKMNKLLILTVVFDPKYKLEFIVHYIGILYDFDRIEITKKRNQYIIICFI